MFIDEFDYELPEELIAQEPLEKRENSRMLVLSRKDNSYKDDLFYNFPNYVNENDVLVLNNTKVFPARLIGYKADTQAKVEIFLVKEIENLVWQALARPARRLKKGTEVIFDENFSATILEKQEKGGHFIVKFQCAGNFAEELEKIGKTPLPPYIKRDVTSYDRQRYQTVYAKKSGAIAAPTAGLHFTEEILKKVEQKGVKIVEVTLHVGYGTFEPVKVHELSMHKVMPEEGMIEEEAAEILNRAKQSGQRIIAVGTTTTRLLEFFATRKGRIKSGREVVDLTITPGYKFKFVDALLTNFHLPKSSLLVMVSTFAGYELIMKAYRHAVSAKYRFYSYGDCMLIL
jgi:S-adenosylmethionine:tRNA ribosyltransferase-isomerase